MLSRKYIEKIRRMDEQLGPPEDSFSPDWHQKNPQPLEGAVLTGPTREQVKDVLTPDGQEK